MVGHSPPVRAVGERGRGACVLTVHVLREKEVALCCPAAMLFWGSILTCIGAVGADVSGSFRVRPTSSGSPRLCPARPGSVRLRPARSGSLRLARGAPRLRPARPGSVRLRPARFGSVRWCPASDSAGHGAADVARVADGAADVARGHGGPPPPWPSSGGPSQGGRKRWPPLKGRASGGPDAPFA